MLCFLHAEWNILLGAVLVNECCVVLALFNCYWGYVVLKYNLHYLIGIEGMFHWNVTCIV